MPVTVKKKPIAAKIQTTDSPPPVSLVVDNDPPISEMTDQEVEKAFGKFFSLPSPPTEAELLAAEIDSLGEMQKKAEKAKAIVAAYQARFNAVREKVLELGQLHAEGAHFEVDVKEHGNKVRKIKDMPLAVKYLGVETFLKVAKIGMADVDAYLTPEQQEDVIEVSESKTRSMTLKKKG